MAILVFPEKAESFWADLPELVKKLVIFFYQERPNITNFFTNSGKSAQNDSVFSGNTKMTMYITNFELVSEKSISLTLFFYFKKSFSYITSNFFYQERPNITNFFTNSGKSAQNDTVFSGNTKMTMYITNFELVSEQSISLTLFFYFTYCIFLFFLIFYYLFFSPNFTRIFI